MERFDRTDLEVFKPLGRLDAWRGKLGELLFYFSEPARELEHLDRQAYVQKARSPGSRVTESEMQELASFMLDVQDLPMRRSYFEGRPINETFQGLSLPLIDWVLSFDKNISSVLNIGAHYGYCDHVVAQRYPNVSFLSVDFAPNLREFNKEFIRPNLDFKTGYALDLLESENVRADVVMMSSTATVIKNSEVKRYLQNVAKMGSYMVFNEPLYNLPGNAVIDPQTVSVDESVPAFQYRMHDGRLGSLCYTHNYRALVEQAGMEVLYYKVFKPSFTDLRMAQVIAKRRGS